MMMMMMMMVVYLFSMTFSPTGGATLSRRLDSSGPGADGTSSQRHA